ncbi:hypothetical protein AURDEDRAFT_116477 [Auricularia subglabra TFB-10046 SS5]|nr:hypothetical protein AURDEDRAFT_116477 [Auricularia subglabra TFB-10046 SS5]
MGQLALPAQPSALSHSRSVSSMRQPQSGLSNHITVRDLGTLLGSVGKAVGDLAGGTIKAVGTGLTDLGDALKGGFHAPPAPGNPSVGGDTGSHSTGGDPSHPAPPLPTAGPPASGGGQAGEESSPPPAPSVPAPPASTTAAPGQGESTLTPASTAADSTGSPSRPAGAETVKSRTGGNAVMAHSDTRAWPSVSSDARGAGLPSTHSPTQSPLLGGQRRGFPLAAAAAIGGGLGFVAVSAICCAVWLWLRKRRRAARAYPAFGAVHPGCMLSVCTVSTLPLFISARDAGVKEDNPFKHPRDGEEDDPFDAASLWRRSASTMSI